MTDEKTIKKQPEEEFIKIQDILRLVVTKWYWFIASLFITLSVAVIYIAITPPVYTCWSSILIKVNSNSRNGGSSDNAAAFSDLGIFRSNTNINNELLTFKSPLLMEEVVQRLKLDMNYELKGRLRNKVLYDQTPVVVLLDSVAENKSFFCNIKLLPENKVRLSNFTVNGIKIKSAIDGNLSDSIDTPWGQVKIIPTSFYSKYYYHTEILFSKYRPKNIAKAYTSRLMVALSDEDATAVDLAINDVSTQRAEDILNTLIAVYNKNWVKDKNQIAVSTSQFIDERLDVIENELGGVDDNISQFKSKNLLPDVRAASSMYLAQSGENNAQILALNTQRTIAQYIRNYLKDPNVKEQLLPENLGAENMGVENQIREYNTMLLRRNNLLANSSENNPVVINLNQSLEAVRRSVANSIDNLLISLDTRIKDVNRSEQQTNQRIASNPEQAKYLLSVERQQKVKESLYLYLLQKREENELSQAFTAYNTKIIVPPSGNSFSTFPKRDRILLIAFLIGLLSPAVIFFLIEKFNTTVRGRKDLSVLSLPFIGEIPLIREKGNKNRGKDDQLTNIVVQERNQDYMNEAFRVVRTNMDFIKGTSEQMKTLMVTSLNVGSGKTFITTNLAVSMAIKGKKVVAIDLDMRKASLSKIVDSPKIGVSNYLGNMVDDTRSIIVKGTVHPNLDIIPVGTIPPNPAELLLDRRLNWLLIQLRRQYDYIFLDCTPVEIVADATIVEKISDATLFVIRAGLMDRRMLPDVEKLYEDKTFKNMGVILNGTVQKQGKYGYRQYGYNYGYGSGK